MTKIIDKTVDFMFSKDSRKWLIPILIIGIILRFIVINNVGTVADEMAHGTHAINIISSGVINEQNQCPAWFYLTDIFYRIFGVNAFSSRFLSFLFGALTILLVYLIAKELFNEKIAIISAFLLSISVYSIRYALMEMDAAMIFFILFAFYYFVRDLRTKEQISYFVPVLLGVAVLIKSIALTFIPAFVIYAFFILYKSPSEKRKELISKNSKRIFISLIIFILFTTPILAYNYILYKQKGIVDVVFSRFFHINREFFAGLQGMYKTFSVNEAISFGLPWSFDTFSKLDPAISFLAVLGIITIFINKNYKRGRFFVLFIFIPFFFLMGSAQLQTHFVSFMPFFATIASVFISFISEKFLDKKNQRLFIYIVLILILFINLLLLMPHLTSKSAVFKMRDYAVSNFMVKDIVVADGRIYRGRIAWMFNDKSYLESSYFSDLIQLNQNLSGGTTPVNLYFVECAADDCGWGTIKDQPDFNQSMEELAGFFRNNSALQKVIYGGGGSGGGDEKGKEYFIIYKATINIHPEAYSFIYQTHDWFYYPVRWAKDDWYDKYTPKGFLQVTFNTIGRIFLWAAVLLALIFPFILFYEIFKSKKDYDKNETFSNNSSI
jgi:4-amino-4-deoxy-L-arabinose transferase-like glycosyltransferase